MSIKEHLQFLAMMVPTLLLLGVMALILAFPPEDSREPIPAASFAQEYYLGNEETVAEETEVQRASAVAARSGYRGHSGQLR